ncbi:MAG: alpha-galactosidase [Tepidisphaeraceae bacterium]
MRLTASIVLTLLLTATATFAAFVSPDEIARRDAWAAARFAKVASTKPEPGLLVLANHDAVSRNSRGNRPLTLGDKQYNRGLYCHAISKIAVCLPSPGKTLSAIVGIDSNDQTRPGKGSVVFSVNVAGKEAFKSPVMREGSPGLPVSVDLAGATSFTLDVSDAGDGISCDQSDWAEAKVVLADGTEVWLGDMPFVESVPDGLPFSFIYAGRPSAELLAAWPRKEDAAPAEAGRTRRTITWTDPATGLEVRCAIVQYTGFPTVEWTLWFRNTSQADTPILSDINAVSLSLSRKDAGDFILHHNAGSQATPDDYRPLRTPLPPGKSLRVASSGGRGSDGVWPYFSLNWGNDGAIVVVGWPGQWTGTFQRDGAAGLTFRAGQEGGRFKLLPGEEIRSPLSVIQFYQGDWLRGQNIWRRWMVAHNIPRLDGKLPPQLLAASSGNQLAEMQNANETNQKQFVDGYIDNGVQLSFWWMDAGWYPFQTGWWNVGTWEPDPKRFPAGLRAVSDHAHAKGVNTLLWFEPERVTPGSWLYEKHPEWLLGAAGRDKLLDLGNPAARQWLVDHVDNTMKQQGIDIYRQDFNFPPLDYWRKNDKPDRQGITEIKHVMGYLAFWDELRRRHPGLLIDTCASGGRRNDLETLRRSVPLHKSDMEYPDLTSKQTQFYGLALWEPYFGAPVYPADRVDIYGFRTGIAMLTGLGYDTRNNKTLDYALLRKLVAERLQVVDYLWSDFYPLTSWSSEADVWMAWQFDRPEDGKGMIQAFRRPKSVYESARLTLRGLDPQATYRIRDLDSSTESRVSGRDLLDKGLAITIPTPRAAVIVVYEKVKP